MNATKITDERRGEYIYAIFKELKKHPDGVERDVLFSNVERPLELTEFERQEYKSYGGRSRFFVFASFACIGTVKAGWLIKGSKDDPRWRITDIRARCGCHALPGNGTLARGFFASE